MSTYPFSRFAKLFQDKDSRQLLYSDEQKGSSSLRRTNNIDEDLFADVLLCNQLPKIYDAVRRAE